MPEALQQSPTPDDIRADRQALEKPREHVATAGEHKFDRLTYGAVGYLANVAISLGAVYWAERTHSGQRFMGGLVNGAKRLLPAVNEKWAGWIAARSFYLTGGFAVLLPMKWLEDNKVGLVKQWDRQTLGDAVDTDPEIRRAHAELEAAPKQSWTSIMGSRVLALIPFYVTTLALWSHTSPLAKVTNSGYRNLGNAEKQAVLAQEQTDLSAFSKTMHKGVYFDRPIAAVSRWIGKGIAKMSGNPGAAESIRAMETKYPGMLKEGSLQAGATPVQTERDPNHAALPYYFISEMITSAMVARGVYLLTRVLAPVMGKKQPDAVVEKAAKSLPAPANDDDMRNKPLIVANDRPRTTIAAAHAEHTAPDAAQQQAAR